MHEWIPWQNFTVDGMTVRGLLKHESGCMRESSCLGMQEHISMYIAKVYGKCYDSARARGGRKLSKTEEVSLRLSRSGYAGGF